MAQRAIAWMVLLAGVCGFAGTVSRADETGTLQRLERSFWLHASLAADTRHGYWGTNFPVAVSPSAQEIQQAARLLTGTYGANRLYLIYHHELSVAEAETVFTLWRKHCPAGVELVPALVLRSYAQPQGDVFCPEEVRRLSTFLTHTLHAQHIAVYDVYQGRDQGAGWAVLTNACPQGLLRLGVQPGEALPAAVVGAVGDTWSAFCHARTNSAWQQMEPGAPTLRRWVTQRNSGACPLAWDLITVAWDYAATSIGQHPGYDDAAKNMPLPAGRNTLAAAEILRVAHRARLAGFSSDLFILDINSRHPAHDGPHGAFYETLKRGEPYRGYYAAPLREIADLFANLKQGHPPR